MCGLFGVVAADRREINAGRVRAAANTMRHRGPDASGSWRGGGVSLAHLRLAIIDLSEEGNQPMVSPCGRYVIVFNGEIYNYVELREELSAAGVRFRTRSDTEVLLQSFIQWGEECVHRFNGDWAFGIWDEERGRLFCSRDRFGVKPFYYALADGLLVFASEAKAVIEYLPSMRRPNWNSIANYCRNSLGGQDEETWFQGVLRLMPAHNLLWEGASLRIRKYWDYPREVDESLSFNAACDLYRDIFQDSVRIRLRSDVPVGTTLSSGLDSGSIAAVVRDLRGPGHLTFTAEYDAASLDPADLRGYTTGTSVDEAGAVRGLARELQLESHFTSVGPGRFTEVLRRLVYHLESGHSSHAIVPLNEVMVLARRHVKVVLEGQGADEVLGGYVAKCFPSVAMELLRRRRFREASAEFQKTFERYSFPYALLLALRTLNSRALEALYHQATGLGALWGPLLSEYRRRADHPIQRGFSDILNGNLARQHSGGLVNLLHYGDAVSMSQSIESRNPFTDVRLVEFAFRLPFDYKVRNGLGKYIHRVAMRGIVPRSVLEQPLKVGFLTPLASQFRGSNSAAVSVLTSDQCLGRGVFAPDRLLGALKAHASGARSYESVLYRCLSVELWFRTFIDGTEREPWGGQVPADSRCPS